MISTEYHKNAEGTTSTIWLDYSSLEFEHIQSFFRVLCVKNVVAVICGAIISGPSIAYASIVKGSNISKDLRTSSCSS